MNKPHPNRPLKGRERRAEVIRLPSLRRGRGRLFCLALAVLLGACHPSDDIDDIFTPHGWSFTGFCYTPNWDSNRSSLLDIQLTGYDVHHLNTLLFQPDGVVLLDMPGCSLTGRWKADGRERTFSVGDFTVTSGSLDALSPYSQKFYKDLRATAWYRGDSSYLQLFDAGEHYYLLLAPMKNLPLIHSEK